MIAIEKPAWYVGGLVFPTEEKADDFLKMKNRLQAYAECTGDDNAQYGAGIYEGLCSNKQERDNFRRWLDRLDKIGEKPPKLDLK